MRVRNSYTVLVRSVQGNELFGEILYFAVLKEATAVAVIQSFQMHNVSQWQVALQLQEPERDLREY